VNRRARSAVAASLFLSLVATGARAGGDQDYEGAGTPAWAKEQVPEATRPFVGRAGLPEPQRSKKEPLGDAVSGIDRYHANHFVVYGPQTAKFLYDGYTPTTVRYKPGTLPTYEAAVAKHAAGLKSDREKAVALLGAMHDLCKHPTMPPCGPGVRADRGLLDEALLKSGRGFCNEQARVYARLCQVAGIPARLVFLFYADNRTGHTIAEFYADGRWSMADSSWFCVFPDPVDGHLMSAAEAHEKGPRHDAVQSVYRERFEELLKLTDEQLGGGEPGGARKGLRHRLDKPDVLGVFGLVNYPLPDAGE
jgi:hypothetical protein